MTKDNKLEQREYDKYYGLKQYLGRLQDEYQTCHIRYMNESDTRQRAMARKDLNEISLRIRRTQQEMNKIKNSIHLKDSMDMLKLSGFTVDSRVSLDLRHQNIDYEKAKQLAMKKEQELKSKYKNVKLVMKMPTNSYFEWEVSNETKDEEVSPKFKKVMEEYGKGELKSSSGEKVTNPKQAKAIAYSEAGESKDGGPGSGIKGHTTSKEESKPTSERKSGQTIWYRGKPYTLRANAGNGYWLANTGHTPPIHIHESQMKDDDATEGGAIREYGDKEEKMEDACSAKDADPKVAEAEAMIKLCGGVM